MKFKVGDMVKVKKDKNCCFGWNCDMNKYAGNTYEIETISYSKYHRQNAICLKETGDIRCWRFSESCLELVNEEITITRKGNKTIATFKNGGIVKTAQARCCPDDTFNFAVGAQIALDRLLSQVEFKPYLFCTKCNKIVGYIGEPNGFTDCDGALLNVGDIVFDKVNNSVRVISTIPCGCSRYSEKCDLKIVKKFNEVENGTMINNTKYVKEGL